MLSEAKTSREPIVMFTVFVLGTLLSAIVVHFITPIFNLQDSSIASGFIYSIVVFIIGGVFLFLFAVLSSKDSQSTLDASAFNGLDCIYIIEYRKRLLSYHSSIRKNSAMNLLIGLFIAFATIYFVNYFFNHESELIGEIKEERIPYYYASRFFAILFINLLVVFFLRLYRQNLHDIKYFQNELSNIDSKLIALYYAKNDDNKEIYYFILKELGKTDRNHILKKGETTVELEKFKCDKSEHYSLMDLISQLLQKLKESSGIDKPTEEG
jgi:hypothetical protein